jgi:Divergent InlB B-repeat domain
MTKNKFFAMTLLVALFLLTLAGTIGVNAQTQATVQVLSSIGGTTDPAAGTYNYNDGTSVTFTATADTGFVFQEWIVSIAGGSNTATDASITIPVTGGVTYSFQAIFAPIQVPPNGVAVTDYTTAAIVVVLAGAGGTTVPVPGTYAINDASQLMLTATAAEGWKFDHWAITGYPMQGAHGSFPFTPNPTDNPYTVDHGYGNTYAYQAVFTPTAEGAATPTPVGATPTPGGMGGLSTEWWIIIGLVVVIILILIGFGIYAMRKH